MFVHYFSAKYKPGSSETKIASLSLQNRYFEKHFKRAFENYRLIFSTKYETISQCWVNVGPPSATKMSPVLSYRPICRVV